MHVRNIAIAAIFLAPVLLALGAASAVAAPPVPRDSPELTIVEPSGKETPLSSFKGKVVLIEFLLVECPHCLRVAQTINKLHTELAGRGFQAVGVAFDNGIGRPALESLVRLLKLDYPVGRTTSDKVDNYLSRSVMERMQVPQLVIVDRTGVIRAQSRAIGETSLEDEGQLRRLVDELLDERVPEKTEPTASAPPTGG
jgi:thiol-disulfide isomerase/thioredoxin